MATNLFLQIDEKAAVMLLAGGGVITAFLVAPDGAMAVVRGVIETAVGLLGGGA